MLSTTNDDHSTGENSAFGVKPASAGDSASVENKTSGENAASGGNTTEDLTAFNLHLNDIDRFANTIALFGSGLVFRATDEVEQTLLMEQAHSITSSVDAQLNYEIAKALANVNWIFLLTVLMFYYTSSERLKQGYEILDLSKESSQERMRGREMVTAGDVFKIIGYTLGAMGFELIADSTLREEQETPPP